MIGCENNDYLISVYCLIFKTHQVKMSSLNPNSDDISSISTTKFPAGLYLNLGKFGSSQKPNRIG